ncbi:hypothetical protein CGRA01v4_06640 [Colletotrichum graminicola]|nr:hypothetical protein CGRA01v4_06640 [Colletotrichum graminicola]
MTSCTPPDSTTMPRSPPSLCQRSSVLERTCRPDAFPSFCHLPLCAADSTFTAIHCRCSACATNYTT